MTSLLLFVQVPGSQTPFHAALSIFKYDDVRRADAAENCVIVLGSKNRKGHYKTATS